MNRLIGWFAANSVAANLLMLFVIAAGALSVSRVRQETYPNVAFDFIAVTVEIPGAAPDEVEEAVCVRIEEAIHGVHGIDRIFSRATEGFGAVWAKLVVGADARQVLDEIKVQVDALDTLPLEAKRPIVRELIDDSVLLGVVAHGAVGERVLRSVGEQLRDEIASLPEVSRTELVGVRPYEIALEVSEADLRRHRLSFDDVVHAVRASSVELAGGALKTRGGEIVVRARSRAYRGAEFERLVLLTRPDGTRLALGDVARVVDGFEETDEKVRFDGEPAVVVRLMTSERRNVLEVSRAVRAYVESRRAALPDGVEVTIWGDQSRQFAGRRNLMLRNGAQGLALMLLVLTLFLRFRLAFWVSLGIPISFLGAIIVLGVTDVSINMMSLFAFVVALGLVVDDSIIVGESVDRWRRVERDPLRAATAGAREVSVPVTAAVLSTVLFALPALHLPTVAGKIAQSLAVVLIASLVFSWIESLLILPAHLARADAPRRARKGGSRLAALQRAVDAGLTRFVERAYRPTLRAALRWPLVAISLAGVTLMLAVALLAGGWVRYSFFPDVEDDFVSAKLVMPDGTPPDVMDAALRRIEGQAIALGDELTAAQEGAATSIIEHVLVAVGDSPDRHDDLNGGGDGPHVGHVRLALAPGERRSVTSMEVADRWRDRVGSIRGAVLLSYRGSDISSDADVALSLAGPDRAELRLAADALKSALGAVPGVRDVVDSLRDGKPELNLRIRPEAAE